MCQSYRWLSGAVTLASMKTKRGGMLKEHAVTSQMNDHCRADGKIMIGVNTIHSKLEVLPGVLQKNLPGRSLIMKRYSGGRKF